MGRIAIPILVAALSFCVWENVEVRAHFNHLKKTVHLKYS